MVKLHAAEAKSPAVQALRLRPPRDEDEGAFTAGHRAMAAEGFVFGLGYEPGQPWRTYLKELEDHRHGRNLPVRHDQTLRPADLLDEAGLAALVEDVPLARGAGSPVTRSPG